MFSPTQPTHQQGWECPKCGSVYAPFVAQCTSCPAQITTTPNTGTTITFPWGICAHEFEDTTGGQTCKLCGHYQAPWTWTVTTNPLPGTTLGCTE